MVHYQPGFAQVPATRCAGLQVRRRAFAFATGFFLSLRGEAIGFVIPLAPLA